MFNAQNRIRQLMAERGWTIYRLAQESGLSQTTISNIFKRNNQPSLPTVNAICDACGITLAQFFTENDTANSPNAKSELDNSVATLNEDQCEALAAFIKTLDKRRLLGYAGTVGKGKMREVNTALEISIGIKDLLLDNKRKRGSNYGKSEHKEEKHQADPDDH